MSPTTMSKKTTSLFATLHASIQDYSIGKEPYTTAFKKLHPHPKTILAGFKAWAPTPEECIARLDHHRADSMFITATALIARRAGEALPDWFLAYMPLAALVHDENVPHHDTLEAFDGLGDALIDEAISLSFEHENFRHQSAVILIPRLEDQAIFARQLTSLTETCSARDVAHCLEQAVDRAMPLVHGMWSAQKSNPLLVLLLMLANQRHAAEDDDVYLEALGDKLKGIRELAQLGISKRGGQARELLERGVKARKKAVREWCADQLAAIGDASEELPELNAFEQLDEAAQRTMQERVDALYQKKTATWNSWVKKEVSSAPMTWMHATLALFEENPDFIHRWAVFKFLLTHKETAAHHEQMWSVYLHHLARAPNLTSNHTRWHLNKHFGLIPREYEPEVLEYALMGATAPMSIPMLEHYFDRCPYSPDMFVMSLKHKSKKVRDAALSKIYLWSEDTDALPIVALLAERKKATRKYAAEALFKMPIEAVAPHLNMLQAHLDKEKDVGVLGALNAIVARITAT
jgi:hypothetical protein